MARELFLYAHPDDETMTAHALLESHEPVVVVATNGEASLIDFVGSDFVRSGKRRSESATSFTCLGVPPERRFYLDLPDGKLAQHLPELQRALRKIVRQFSIDTIVTLGPDGYDGHADHIATHDAAMSLVKDGELECVLALNRHHLGQARIVRGEKATKLKIFDCHASQFKAVRTHSIEPYMPLMERETYDRFA